MNGGENHPPSAVSSAANNNNSANALSTSINNNRSQNQQFHHPAASWLNGTTLSLSISTPGEDLSIQFPSIQLPPGISSFLGELTTAVAPPTGALSTTTTSGNNNLAPVTPIIQNGSISSTPPTNVTPPTAAPAAHLSSFSPVSGHDQQQQQSGSRASSSPAHLTSSSSSSSVKGRASGGAASASSPSYIIPMQSDCSPSVVGAGGDPNYQKWKQKYNNMLMAMADTAADAAMPPPLQMVQGDENVAAANNEAAFVVHANVVNSADDADAFPQQRQRRRCSNNCLRTSQSADPDRLSRAAARRTSRPQKTTPTRRHTDGTGAAASVGVAAAAINASSASSSSTSSSTNSSTPSSTENGDENSHHHNNNNATNDLRQRLNNLFRMRHVIVRNLLDEAGEFPSLYVIGSIFCALFILLVVLIQFFVDSLVAALALLFSVAHFSDMFSFKRFVTGGQPSGWMIAAKVLLRQFMVGTVLGQTQWALPSLAFQQQMAPPPATSPLDVEDNGTILSSSSSAFATAIYSPTFWSTLYIVVLAQFLVMDLLLLIKLAVASLPASWLGAAAKRRIYQWAEYTCALYRFALPFVPWNAYFNNTIWLTVLYGGIKLLFGFALVWAWLLATMRFFRSTHIGSLASEADFGQGEQCTICFGDFRVPIKLKCSHIFCTECIRTWLDREVTCPICRAVVTREDNHYRNGDSMLPCVF